MLKNILTALRILVSPNGMYLGLPPNGSYYKVRISVTQYMTLVIYDNDIQSRSGQLTFSRRLKAAHLALCGKLVAI